MYRTSANAMRIGGNAEGDSLGATKKCFHGIDGGKLVMADDCVYCLIMNNYDRYVRPILLSSLNHLL